MKAAGAVRWTTTSRGRLCPEFAAIIAATVFPHTPDSLAAFDQAVRRVTDWPHFFDVLRKHCVEGLVYRSISQLSETAMPSPELAKLKALAQRSGFHALQTAHETHRLTQSLAEQGIPVGVLKGTPLAVRAYGNVTLRHSKDIDLLVMPAQVDAADKFLRERNWMRNVPPETWTEEDLRPFRLHRSHYEYVDLERRLQVELHWRLVENEDAGLESPGPESWQQIAMEDGGSRLPILNDLDMLEYLCLHGASHGWSRLKWLADVRTILGREKDLREPLVRQAQRHGTMRPVALALLLCHQLYGDPFPNGLARDYRVRLLRACAYKTMTLGCGAGELRDFRFMNALVHASHLLWCGHLAYVKTELINEILTPPAWTTITEASKARRLLHHIYRWSRGLRRQREDKPAGN